TGPRWRFPTSTQRSLSITDRGETLTYCCVCLCTTETYTAVYVSLVKHTPSTQSKTAHS
ncbi:unnamed protein product, partial [Staurois parvus]